MRLSSCARAPFLCLVGLVAGGVVAGCKSPDRGTEDDGGTGAGGSVGTGGHANGGSGGGGGGGGGGATGTGGRGGSGGATGTGGATGSGGATGTGGTTGSGGATGTGGSAAASCTDGKQDGTETGVDCGGSCAACPNYQINPPNTNNNVGSSCQNGAGFMCARSMLFSPEFKQAAAADWSSTDPPYVYGVVGHDKDPGALDTQSGNTCCECYELRFVSPQNNALSAIAKPKPMIVQAFNTAAGGAKNFDIYMAMGGYGGNSAGCPRMYIMLPSIGEPTNGGVTAQNVSQCGNNGQLSVSSVSSTTCQSAISAQCDMIQSASAVNQSTSQTSCIEANQPDSLYHMNWNVMAKRVECPVQLTRVTGCRLNGQGLPSADPTSSSGFMSGYTTTTMQDCCRPTCAYSTNVNMSGVGTQGGYGVFYTCDASGNPS